MKNNVITFLLIFVSLNSFSQLEEKTWLSMTLETVLTFPLTKESTNSIFMVL